MGRTELVRVPRLLSRTPIYEQLLSKSAITEHAYGVLTPTTDDRPFFNQRRGWWTIRAADIKKVFSQGSRARMALEDEPVAEVSLVALLLQAVVLAALFTFVPVWFRRKKTPLPIRGSVGLLAYFVVLGFGFIFVELGLVNRLGLFLGTPTLTFATVVGVLLVASGFGGTRQRTPQTRPARREGSHCLLRRRRDHGPVEP